MMTCLGKHPRLGKRVWIDKGGLVESHDLKAPLPPNPAQVHAFNCLRMIFTDTDLSVDTQCHCAEGLRVSIKAFGAKHWEVCHPQTLE